MGRVISRGPKNILAYSQEMGNWVELGTCDVTPDAAADPEGRMTADLLDNDAGTSVNYRYVTSSPGDLINRTFTGGVWARAAAPRTSTIGIWELGVAFTLANISVTADWQFFTASRTCNASGGGLVGLILCPGQYGVSKGATYFSMAQCNEGTILDKYVRTFEVART